MSDEDEFKRILLGMADSLVCVNCGEESYNVRFNGWVMVVARHEADYTAKFAPTCPDCWANEKLRRYGPEPPY